MNSEPEGSSRGWTMRLVPRRRGEGLCRAWGPQPMAEEALCRSGGGGAECERPQLAAEAVRWRGCGARGGGGSAERVPGRERGGGGEPGRRWEVGERGRETAAGRRVEPGRGGVRVPCCGRG